jgi:protein transport protein SEC24
MTNGIGGKIIVFTSSICTTGLGATSSRDDPKLYNSDKEKIILQPATDFYVLLAEDCVKRRISVDMFYCLNNPKSVDLTTVAPLPTHTGGDLYFYNPFDATKHGERLHNEIFRVLTRTQGNDVAIKARTSTGYSVIEYFGGFGVKETIDFDLASIDSDKFVGFLIRCDEKMKEDSICHVQFAMMYTTFYGEKRIRVFNQCFPMAKNLNAYYKSADCEGLSTFTVKREVSRVMVRGGKGAKESVINNLVNLLHIYRQKCAAQTAPS